MGLEGTPFEYKALRRTVQAIWAGRRAAVVPDEGDKSRLGSVLLGQKKYADAEPLLLQGYAGLKQRETKIPAEAKVRLTEALKRLVQLYDSWDKKDEAARGRKELEATKKQ